MYHRIMAKVISSAVPVRPWRRYPWDEWFDGKARELARGEDFTVSTVNFRSAAVSAARRMGIRVAIAIRGDSVLLQAIPDATS